MSINVMPNSVTPNLNPGDLNLADLASPNQKMQVDANGKLISLQNLKKTAQKGQPVLNEFDSELMKSLGQVEPQTEVTDGFENVKAIDSNLLNKKNGNPSTNTKQASGLNIESILGNVKTENKKELPKKNGEEQVNDVQLKNIINPTVAEAPKANPLVTPTKNPHPATNNKNITVAAPAGQKAPAKEASPTLVNILNKKNDDQVEAKPAMKATSSLNTVLENKNPSMPTAQAKPMVKHDAKPLQSILEKNSNLTTAVKPEAPKDSKTLESLFKDATSKQTQVEERPTSINDFIQKNSNEIAQPVKSNIENSFDKNINFSQAPKAKTAVQPEIVVAANEQRELNQKLNSSVQEFNKNYAYNSYSKNYGGEAVKKSAINYEPVVKENKNSEIKNQDNVLAFNRNIPYESAPKNNSEDLSFTQAASSDNNTSQGVTRNQQTIIDNITNYVAQNAKTNKDEIQFKIKDETGGNININIKKSKVNENLNIQISVDNPEIREMLTVNNKELLTQLSNAGIKVQSFKVEGQNSFNLRNESSDSSSSFSQNQRSSYDFQQGSSGETSKREDSSRRQHLWDMYRERMSA